MKKTIYSKVAFLAGFLLLGIGANAQQPRAFGRPIKQAPDSETGLIRCVSAEYEESMRENSLLQNRNEFEAIIAQRYRNAGQGARQCLKGLQRLLQFL